MAWPQVRSRGVVIFRFSSLPRVRWTGRPSRSTAAQSSVRETPASAAWARASRMRAAWKIWGVWTAKSRARSGGALHHPRPGHLDGVLHRQGRGGGPWRAAARRVSSRTSWGRKGRAPSWMAMRSAWGSVSPTPARTEAVRSAPALHHPADLVQPAAAAELADGQEQILPGDDDDLLHLLRGLEGGQGVQDEGLPPQGGEDLVDPLHPGKPSRPPRSPPSTGGRPSPGTGLFSRMHGPTPLLVLAKKGA